MRTLTPALLVAALVPAGPALGAQGDLDPTFNSDGRRVVEALVNVEAVALQPDGKVVVVGPFAFSVARLNPDGATDSGFGDGGVRVIHPGLNTSGAPTASSASSAGTCSPGAADATSLPAARAATPAPADPATSPARSDGRR